MTPLIHRADREAAAALAEVDGTAVRQLRVLDALQALVAACDDEGLVRGVIAQFLAERQAAFVAFHERVLRNEDGALDEVRFAAAWDEAIDFTVGVFGEGEEAMAMRRRKQESLAAGRPPVPFFARFLEGQQR